MAKKTVKSNGYDPVETTRVIFAPKTDEQKAALKTISENVITFVKGIAGSGKTFIAIAYAMQQLLRGKYERLVLTRPVVEAAGEKLGFLPGTLYDKIDPYMIPFFSNAMKLMDEDVLKRLTSKNGHPAKVQVLPLAFMRGVTFDNTIVICDESQNSTPEQIRMLTTRIGENSKIIICGDISQSDIFCKSGLEESYTLLDGVPGIGFVTMSEESVVRHPIIRAIEERFNNRAKSNQKNV